MKTIKTSKEIVRLIKWVSKAVSKDSARPVLTFISVRNDRIEAADGRRAHATERIMRDELPDGCYKVTSASGEIITLEEDSENMAYPDLKEAIKINPTAKFAVNPAFLSDAASGFFGSVTIEVQGNPDGGYSKTPIRLTGKDKEGNSLVTIIMPMFLGDGDAKWNPY